jgi:putative DNA methylase
MPEMKKKLIEVALPLETINTQSAREKSIRHGHPSTLHLWWARRPLAAARAVIWASLVDDPSSLPEQFPTEEAQNAERERLFKILSELVKWENSNNEEVLNTAKAEIMKSTGGNPPALLDPFAGGGAIPLEAQRLGLEAHASDLNPVAVMINKAMIEIPPKFAGQPPINPDARNRTDYHGEWKGAAGLAEDVRYYGEWMKQRAFEKIGHLYPKVKDEHGREHTVIAWIWARTVKCPNPACGCEMPLVKSWVISKKKGREVYIEAIPQVGNNLRYSIKYGKPSNDEGTVNRKGAFCRWCASPVSFQHIREESKAGRLSSQMVAVAGESHNGRVYISASDEQIYASSVPMPNDSDFGELAYYPGYINPYAYGITEIKSLFTNRQLTAIMTFASLCTEVMVVAENNAITADLIPDNNSLNDGGKGAKAYGEAIATYLALAIDKLADRGSSICGWDASRDGMRNTFGLTGMSMSWDYAESNPFSNSSGCFDNAIDWIARCIQAFPKGDAGISLQFDAQSDNGLRNIMISTDPPYYSNVPYADFSDFFYVLLRKSLKDIYPNLFRTLQTPKVEELVADPYRAGSREKASEHFENGMLAACRQMYLYANMDVPVTIYYSFKQNDAEKQDENIISVSTGWETMLTAIIQSGFSITGTWPMRTEMANRTRANESNALASSIVLVCRKRPTDAPTTTRRDFVNTLKRELKPALQKLQASNIAPVDLAQSAIGPGMGVYSRFSQVLEADGTPMSVRSALQIINQELDLYFTEQDGELDRDSRFCVDLYTQYAFNDMKFGEADVLARAKNTSVEKLAGRGVLYAQKGVVRLLTREEIPEKTDREIIWLLCQQLTRAMEKDGVTGAAKIVADIFTSEPEHAKALAYRLFQIAERKGWAGEAFAYNSLVISWPEVLGKAAELQAQKDSAKQMTIFDIEEEN